MVGGKVLGSLSGFGGSNNKPYCDGTHVKIGFKAEPIDQSSYEDIQTVIIQSNHII